MTDAEKLLLKIKARLNQELLYSANINRGEPPLKWTERINNFLLWLWEQVKDIEEPDKGRKHG